MNLLLYVVSYFLICLGYFLGKATKYEHNEIKFYVKQIVQTLNICFYILVFYLFRFEIYVLSFTFVLFCLYVFLEFKTKFKYLEKFQLVVFGFFFVLISSFFEGYVYLLLILVFSNLLEKSFLDFSWKREVFDFLIFVVIGFLGFLFFNL